jgi:hypothetical protein
MPLSVPTLDDRRFDDLVAEARAMIPTHAPGWTDHNPTDPGITLIEMFAYLAEALMYRLDRVTPEQIHAFLNLLDNSPAPKPSDLPTAIRQTILKLRTIDRAVATADFEMLARLCPLSGDLARVRCLAGNLENADDIRDEDISIIVLPVKTIKDDLQRIAALETAVRSYLDARRLLATRLHVVQPSFVSVDVAVTIVPRSDQREIPKVLSAVTDAVTRFLDPYGGGADGGGWPFGRGVFISELYALISRLPPISYVDSIVLTLTGRDPLPDDGKDVGVHLNPYELVHATVRASVKS